MLGRNFPEASGVAIGGGILLGGAIVTQELLKDDVATVEDIIMERWRSGEATDEQLRQTFPDVDPEELKKYDEM